MTAQTLDVFPTPQLPLRKGRHRNRALAAYRRDKAIQMRIAGATYQEVADELGYANRGTVCRIVNEALAAHEAESVDSLRDVEVARLDALQSRLWGRAMAGDLAAASAIIRIITTRIRVLGLSAGGPGGCDQPQTVVLREDDCRLRGCPEHA